ncbi:Protein kinase-like domain [Pseudocohnilembus persalinus]|uniref:Protein kinase-like domain n=1 Tax=Pseudocohnilembus persalinus TaxID=266149 RepID=A0A0V0R5B5_PSEPJ|nr:Protein kinase-like domain [Pseudocohnilembus persalinus]|eukprot:KRX09429.1 Protein kinase-like domain [Pseudocohnilembus persalinus]
MENEHINTEETHMLEYSAFKKKFQFMYLTGLKGLEKACQIQEKQSNKLFDYFEHVIKVNILKANEDANKIDEFAQFCENLFKIDNNSILKLHYYARFFAEPDLGEAFCKYLLVFEYTESTLESEINHLKKSQSFFKKKQMQKLFRSLGSAIDYFHTNQQIHGDLRTCKIYTTESGEFKLIPQKINPRGKNDFYGWSPEIYEKKNFRDAFDKFPIDQFKSEIFSLGILLLEVGTFLPSEDFYGKFDMKSKREILDERLLMFQSMYGYHLGQIVLKCVDENPKTRIDANNFKLLLDSKELQDQEKIWNQSQQEIGNLGYPVLQNSQSNNNLYSKQGSQLSKFSGSSEAANLGSQKHQKSQFGKISQFQQNGRQEQKQTIGSCYWQKIQQNQLQKQGTISSNATPSNFRNRKNKNVLDRTMRMTQLIRQWSKQCDKENDEEAEKIDVFQVLPQELRSIQVCQRYRRIIRYHFCSWWKSLLRLN